MRWTAGVTLVTALAGLPHAASATEPAPLPGTPPFCVDTTIVDAGLGALAEQANLSGATLWLGRNGQPVYTRELGHHAPDTGVRIISATKWVSAATIATLIRDGLLTLDDTLAQHLGTQGIAGTITVRQLLSHTSGLIPMHTCLSDTSVTLAACSDAILAEPLVTPPGTHFAYGDASFQVAGRVAEVVTGIEWNTLFDQRLRSPLAATSMTYGLTCNPYLARGITSTAEDYGRFLLMLQADGRIDGQPFLPTPLVDAMLTDQTDGAVADNEPMFLGYGLGAWVNAVDGQGRPTEFDCPGALGSMPWLDRARNLAGVFVTEKMLGMVRPGLLDLREQLRVLLDARHPADLDCSNTVTQADLDRLRSCMNGSRVHRTVACHDADLDADGDVDQSDFGLWQPCLAGEHTPIPDCGLYE